MRCLVLNRDCILGYRDPENKLAQFKIELDADIVDVTSDGASVMKKLGKLISAEQQLCFAHAIHLAVLDVMYKKKSKQPEERNVSEDNNEDNSADNNEDNNEDNSADNNEDNNEDNSADNNEDNSADNSENESDYERERRRWCSDRRGRRRGNQFKLQ
ncbi:unnamed protein product [Parnassius apollo]|uniref:(apollo) hypothetical protein n=1 Tax=Parnassius apollo TaxID=110799 RepID=A0A8S3WHD7_PARAO|nr:unnamed protein product [Parnassius apollo]